MATRAATRVDTFGLEQIARVRRARLLNAMVNASCDQGAGSVTVTDVVKRSGMSRRTFYEMFTDRDDCFVAAFEHTLTIATERVSEGYDPAAGWRERVQTGLVALLSFLDEEPRLGRLLLVESIAGGPRVAARRSETIAKLTTLLDEGANETRSASDLPALTSEGLVGAVLSVLQNRLLDPTHGSLFALTNELASMIFLPYLGAATARRELERPLPTITRPDGDRIYEPSLSDPFKAAGMRLTYRTVRVLSAAADHPGASNRLIGQTAEISDQGQISKLLGRLQRVGMLENTGVGPVKGGPNAWSLTDAGLRVVHSIRDHSEYQSQNGTH
ncbi:MAG TPA: TetR/AcrR family transcriptional regulator [Solirubrobacteraceae bacterium]